MKRGITLGLKHLAYVAIAFVFVLPLWWAIVWTEEKTGALRASRLQAFTLVPRFANRVAPEDVDHLRAHGLTDKEIFDITLAAAARVFYSKVLQAMDAEPDAALAATNGLVDLVELRPG